MKTNEKAGKNQSQFHKIVSNVNKQIVTQNAHTKNVKMSIVEMNLWKEKKINDGGGNELICWKKEVFFSRFFCFVQICEIFILTFWCWRLILFHFFITICEKIKRCNLKAGKIARQSVVLMFFVLLKPGTFSA